MKVDTKLNNERVFRRLQIKVDDKTYSNLRCLLKTFGCGIAWFLHLSLYLLYKDYQGDQKLTITTYSSTGVAITTSGTNKGNWFVGDVATQVKNKNFTVDIKVAYDSSILTIFTYDEATPGLKAIVSAKVPDQKSAKVELQYLHPHAGICTSVGLTTNPVVNFSGVIGTSVLALGTDVSFDTESGNFKNS
ncbi:mitochondrial outer membrane protein porin 3-like [Brassica napus]|uniref:mitochondrial outer membrane protein porin 3-like n=1 Tax=Brassica napus TaxID=3708 RepID=UPI0006AB3B83|nr:mitochondrial outer membrane protein porin 3-like [Brassica napus]